MWSGDNRRTSARFGATLFGAVLLAAVVVFSGTSTPARADYTDGVIASTKISLEEAIRIWRRSAWQDDDFLAEVRLGDIYGDERGDNKFSDPVEAYVWYYLASISNRIEDHIGDPNARRIISNDFHRALNEQQKLMLLLTADQREQARNRIVYILSCRGADGYIRLGQIHSTLLDQNNSWRDTPDYSDGANESPETFSGLTEVWHAQRDFRDRALHEYDVGDALAARHMMGISSSSVIVPSDGEALMYFHIADNMGHPLAREYLRGLDAAVRSAKWLGPRISQEAAEKAKYWFPPYEFYPLGDVASGVPYTDDCVMSFERERALALISAIPFKDIHQALWFLGLASAGDHRIRPVPEAVELRAMARFQATLGDTPDGRLTPLQTVRLIQTAAIRGDAASQNTLGVMYAKGIGVPLNYVRSAYWFSKSSDQRYAVALYHLGELYKKGPDGIHQDISKANDYFTASALAGFKPGMIDLYEALDSADSGPHREGRH